MKYLPDEDIRNSPVVANCRMNRKRKLVGINSYEKELGFNIADYLIGKASGSTKIVRWLDMQGQIIRDRKPLIHIIDCAVK